MPNEVISDKRYPNELVENEDSAFVRVTNLCNQACIYCSAYQSEQMDEKTLLDFLSSGKREVMLTGGEPLLRNDILKLISIVKNSGTKEIELQTNGTMVYYRQLAKKLVDSGITLFNVAMPSHVEEINDIITQRHGLFDKRIGGIKNLLEYGGQVRITNIINKLNAEYMEKYAEFVNDNFPKIKILEFNLLKIMGRAENAKWLMPKVTEIEDGLMRTLRFCKEMGINVLVDGIPLCHLKGYETYAVDVLKIVGNKKFLDSRMKNEKCVNCSLTNICRGFRDRYFEIHGSSEVDLSSKPIESVKKFFE